MKKTSDYKTKLYIIFLVVSFKMGASMSDYPLPGKPNLFHKGSKVNVFMITCDNIGQPLPSSLGKVIQTHDLSYDIQMDSGEVHIKVPYFLVDFPKEDRFWSDYFVDKQRVLMIENDKKCVILSVYGANLTLQEVGSKKMHFNVKPNEIIFDMDYYLKFIN